MCRNDECPQVDKNDYEIFKVLCEMGSEYCEDSGQMWAREDDTNKRIFSLDLPSRMELPRCTLQLDALENLDICLLGRLPRWIGQLKSLKYLSIDIKTPQALPEELGDLTNLEYLSVHNHRVNSVSFPTSLSKLPKLEFLVLPDFYTQKNIGQFQSLKRLRLKCDEFLPSICKLHQLEDLYLYDSENLRSLPDEIGNLKNLKFLNLRQSGIEMLPQSVGKLQNLETLNLDCTHNLQSLPEEIGMLRGLQNLFLNTPAAHGADKIPSTIFSLRNLERLHLNWAFHNAEGGDNYNMLYRLVEECPHLSFIQFQDYRDFDNVWESVNPGWNPRLAYSLMCNRIKTKLCHGDAIPNTSADRLEHQTSIALWPFILEQFDRDYRTYVDGYSIKQFDHPDAMHYLITNNFPTLLEAVKKNENLPSCRKIVSAQNIDYPMYDTSEEIQQIDQSDYEIAKEYYEIYLDEEIARSRREPPREAEVLIYPGKGGLFSRIRVREEDVHKRIYEFRQSGMTLTRKLLGLDALERLYISQFSEWMVNFKNLKMLSISFVNEIPKELGNLIQIEELFLGLEGRVLLPKTLSKLENLVKLSILAERIPRNINRLKHLQHMNVGVWNGMRNPKSIPRTIGDLRELTHLNLEGAELSFLPDEIGNLSNLQVLNLSKSHIKKLPRTIGNLKNLTQLNLLETKKLRALPEEIGGLVNLQNLELRVTFDEKADFNDDDRNQYGSFFPLTILNLKSLRVLHMHRRFHRSDKTRQLFSRLVGECPHLGCLGCEQHVLTKEKEQLFREEFQDFSFWRELLTPEFQNYGAFNNVELAHRLMCNRMNTRLFPTRCNPCGNEDLKTKPSMWPFIIEQAKRAMAPYKSCNRGTLRLGCGKQFEEQDAIYQLLRAHAPVVLQARKIDAH